MPDPLEYIVTGGMLQCDKGAALMPFTCTSNTTVHVKKLLVATEMDKAPIVNIPSFVMCSVGNKPCVPAPTAWVDTYEFVKIKGFKPLLYQSCMPCSQGGKIEFLTSGQIPLDEAVDAESLKAIEDANKQAEDMKAEYEAEQNSVGEAGLVEGFIPVWGSGRDAIHSFQTGHWGWGIFHSAMVVVDVLTLGTGTVVKGVIRGGIKGGMRAFAKGAAKKMAAVMAAKATAKALLKEGINKAAIKFIGKCVTACFPAGTPVATRDGLTNIEDIQIGDQVWAYDEKTGEIGLKTVLNTLKRAVYTLVELTVEGEVIKSTPDHPFYANGDWKEAGLLETGDRIMLFSGKLAKVEKVVYELDAVAASGGSPVVDDQSFGMADADRAEEDGINVYNLTVEGWSSYFVGWLKLLVHNAGICIQAVLDEIKAGKKGLREIMLGRTPGKASKTGKEVIEKMGDKIRYDRKGNPTHFQSTKDGEWYPLKDADMSHKTDAVKWWNETGRDYGARSKEVRDWMLNSDNYYLEHFKYNRSDGAKIGENYLLPTK
jgi:hypothetical protein